MIQHPIRILHVVTTMGLGGIETLLMSVYRNIDRNKIQFDFLVHREEEGVFDDEILSLGGRIYRMPPLSPGKFFSYRKKLKLFLITNKFTIIHSHLNANSTIILSIAKEVGVPVRIAHSHINKSEGGKWYLKSFLKRFINHYTTLNFAASVEAGQWLFGDKKEFTVVTNSIKVENFKFNSDFREKLRIINGIKSNEFVIGHIGRFTDQKNHQFILKIVHELVQKNNDFKLLLIGGGEKENEIKKTIDEFNLQSNVLIIGQALNVNEYLSAMDLFLFPSKFEGLGIVGIEAQASGLPIILSDCLPKDLDQTSLVYRLSLNDKVYKWTELIEKLSKDKIDRSSYNDIIKNSNYNIDLTVSRLTQIYMNLHRKF